MHLLILGDPHASIVKDLQRSAEPTHRATVGRLHQLGAQISGEDHTISVAGRNCREFDVILVRTMPHGSLEQAISTMNLLGQLEAAGCRVVNSARALEIAIDKYLSIAELHRRGVKVPATVLCQSIDEALETFALMQHDIVLKPLFGGEGRGLMRIREPEVLERASRVLLQLDRVLCFQQFVPNAGWDYRLFVLGPDVWGIRRHATRDWRTNLSQGATAEPVELTGELAHIGRQAAKAVGCELAGVDVMEDLQGERFVLEVNAVPGWNGLARALNLDLSRRVIEYLATR